MRPSRRAAISAYWMWSRPCVVARKLSPRPPTRRRAARAHRQKGADHVLGVEAELGPNPPPMSGATSRSFWSGRPRHAPRDRAWT